MAGRMGNDTTTIKNLEIISVTADGVVLKGLLSNFIGLDPIKALIYSAVANGLVAPIILVLIILLARNKKIMGKHAVSKFTQGLGWVIVSIMTISGLAVIWAIL
jgi:Mn2+/Fe2+ NRAMP family transporter